MTRTPRHLSALAAIAFGGALLAPPASAAKLETGGAAAVVPVVPGASAPGTDGAPGGRGRLVGARAVAPAGAPPVVVKAIEAANAIAGRPYRYGGGHRSFEDTGYDCSGAVSYALNGGGLLKAPLDSSSFMRWGARGRGRWITVYTNPGHAYVVIAGLRFDTSLGDGVENRRSVASTARGPQWRGTGRSMRGYVARHPVGL
ncbi:MAG: hypothetical protein WKF31_03050 [Thermoleophilaceae bacterium]